MIHLTPQPPNHMHWSWNGANLFLCARCDWARLHYNLAHWVRVRQEHKI